jgi:predicted glycoside hydrolase/deacetylase ChbG (UPF0249 family)
MARRGYREPRGRARHWPRVQDSAGGFVHVEKRTPEPAGCVIVTADDYGYGAPVDRGILEAARAGAVDAVSAMVERDCDPEALLEARVEVGLHLELPGAPEPGGARAGPRERAAAVAAAGAQIERFRSLFGREPAYLDGHRHCHAAPGLGAAIGHVAAERGLAVRSVGAAHRRTLRCLGVRTPDRLVGRLVENEEAVPAELRPLLGGGNPPPGVTEWMVHPGYRNPAGGSRYDAGREEDLRLLLELTACPGVVRARATHAEALGSVRRR